MFSLKSSWYQLLNSNIKFDHSNNSYCFCPFFKIWALIRCCETFLCVCEGIIIMKMKFTDIVIQKHPSDHVVWPVFQTVCVCVVFVCVFSCLLQDSGYFYVYWQQRLACSSSRPQWQKDKRFPFADVAVSSETLLAAGWKAAAVFFIFFSDVCVLLRSATAVLRPASRLFERLHWAQVRTRKSLLSFLVALCCELRRRSVECDATTTRPAAVEECMFVRMCVCAWLRRLWRRSQTWRLPRGLWAAAVWLYSEPVFGAHRIFCSSSPGEGSGAPRSLFNDVRLRKHHSASQTSAR